MPGEDDLTLVSLGRVKFWKWPSNDPGKTVNLKTVTKDRLLLQGKIYSMSAFLTFSGQE